MRPLAAIAPFLAVPLLRGCGSRTTRQPSQGAAAPSSSAAKESAASRQTAAAIESRLRAAGYGIIPLPLGPAQPNPPTPPGRRRHLFRIRTISSSAVRRLPAVYCVVHGTWWCVAASESDAAGRDRVLRAGVAARRRDVRVRVDAGVGGGRWLGDERGHGLPLAGTVASRGPSRDELAGVVAGAAASLLPADRSR